MIRTNEPATPYLRGRSEFDSVFGDLAKGKRNWQLVAFAALGIGLVLAGGLISVATQSRITPYVVEVDRLGQAQAFGPADQLRAVDQRVLVSQLARFVRDIRTVLGDPAGQADLIKRAYAFVDRNATPFLNDYFTSPANDPRVLGKDLTRLVEITSILPVPATTSEGSQTWKVSWTESSLPRAGGGAATESSVGRLLHDSHHAAVHHRSHHAQPARAVRHVNQLDRVGEAYAHGCVSLIGANVSLQQPNRPEQSGEVHSGVRRRMH